MELNRLIEELDRILENAAWRFDDKFTTVRTIQEALSMLEKGEFKYVKTRQKLKFVKIGDKYSGDTEQQHGVQMHLELPISVLTGEVDTRGSLTGHGVLHIKQGHESDYSTGKNIIDRAVTNCEGKTYYNNKGHLVAEINYRGFRFVFGFNNDNTEALLLTYFKP